MKSKKNCKKSRNWGIASIVMAFLSPIISIVFGIIGLTATHEKDHEDRDTNLNWAGIIIATINWIIAIIIFL